MLAHPNVAKYWCTAPRKVPQRKWRAHGSGAASQWEHAGCASRRRVGLGDGASPKAEGPSGTTEALPPCSHSLFEARFESPTRAPSGTWRGPTGNPTGSLQAPSGTSHWDLAGSQWDLPLAVAASGRAAEAPIVGRAAARDSADCGPPSCPTAVSATRAGARARRARHARSPTGRAAHPPACPGRDVGQRSTVASAKEERRDRRGAAVGPEALPHPVREGVREEATGALTDRQHSCSARRGGAPRDGPPGAPVSPPARPPFAPPSPPKPVHAPHPPSDLVVDTLDTGVFTHLFTIPPAPPQISCRSASGTPSPLLALACRQAFGRGLTAIVHGRRRERRALQDERAEAAHMGGQRCRLSCVECGPERRGPVGPTTRARV